MRLQPSLARVAWLVVGLVAVPGMAAEPTWQAGTARVNVTPREPMFMAGYASRKTPSEGTASDLWIKVLALEDGSGRRSVWVTADLISIPQPLRVQVAEAVSRQHRLDPAALWMNCSHTHCGPVVRDNVESSVMYDVDAVHADRIARYFEQLRDQTIEAIGRALADLQPVVIGYSHARCGFAMNRRLPTSSGFQNSPYPDGPVDHDVPVLKVERAGGELKAIVFGYACHNTTTALMQFNGDYAGFAQSELETAHPGCLAMFVMGCGGDQNPYPRGKLEMARTHGQSLASAVEAALLPAATRIAPSLQFAYSEVDLPFVPLTREDIAARQSSNDQFEKRRGSALLAEWESQGKVRESYPYPVQVFRLGGQLTIVSLGGEVVVDYSIRLKRELTELVGGAIWVAGYSHDVMAYIPSERVLAEGGYEGGGAMRYSNLPNPWRPGIEDRIIGTVHAALKAVQEK